MQAAQCLLGGAIGGRRAACELRELALQTAVLFDELTHHVVERFDELGASNSTAASRRCSPA